MLDINRDITPAQHPLPLDADNVSKLRLQAGTLGSIPRQEAHRHPVTPRWGKRKVDRLPQQRVRQLQQNAGTVTGLGIGPLRSPMRKPFQGVQRPADSLSTGLPPQVGHQRHPTPILR
jgi:hypothetical protein